MSTNSSIIVKCADGKYRGVYCHWDGYIDHNGRLLLEHYNSEAQAEALVKIGYISVLAATTLNPPGHTFDKGAENCSIFYGRDRNEEDAECLVANTYDECLERLSQGFDYFWDGNEWLVTYNLNYEDALSGKEIDEDITLGSLKEAVEWETKI